MRDALTQAQLLLISFHFESISKLQIHFLTHFLPFSYMQHSPCHAAIAPKKKKDPELKNEAKYVYDHSL
jgi:hypothetical protein